MEGVSLAAPPHFPELPPMAFSGVGTGWGPCEAPVTYGCVPVSQPGGITRGLKTRSGAGLHASTTQEGKQRVVEGIRRT